MPMTVVHFDDNFETTHTEEYNMENFELAEWQIESLARMLLPSIREYYRNPEYTDAVNERMKQQNEELCRAWACFVGRDFSGTSA